MNNRWGIAILAVLGLWLLSKRKAVEVPPEELPPPEEPLPEADVTITLVNYPNGDIWDIWLFGSNYQYISMAQRIPVSQPVTFRNLSLTQFPLLIKLKIYKQVIPPPPGQVFEAEVIYEAESDIPNFGDYIFDCSLGIIQEM